MNYTRKVLPRKSENVKYIPRVRTKMECKTNTTITNWIRSAQDINTQQMKSVILFPFPSLALVFSYARFPFSSLYYDSMVRKLFDFPQFHSKKYLRCLDVGMFAHSGYIMCSHSGFHKRTYSNSNLILTLIFCSLFKYHLLVH